MKAYTTLLLIILFSTSCKESNQEVHLNDKTNEVVNNEAPFNGKAKSNTTYLCQINGTDWGYTKASGIVSRHKKTKKRTAIITFTKQLDKGRESVQLYYDGDSFQLESASVNLKFPKKGGGRMTAFYQLFPDTRKRNPESHLSGTIDLSDPKSASGQAELSKLNINWEKEKLEDIANSVITVSGIKFSGIGYSDAEKLFGYKSN